MDTTSYEEWLLARSLGRGTVYNYRGKLARAARIAEEQGWDLADMSASQIRSLADRFPPTPATQRILRCALTHYWTMIGATCPAGAIAVPKPPPVRYRGLTEEAAATLESHATGRWPDGAAVLLGLYLALRREEIATLQWSDFEEEHAWVRIMGKGHRQRDLPVHPLLQPALQTRAGTGYLFPGRTDGHVHVGTVRMWIGRVATQAGVGDVSPHQLRHTCLSTMNDATGDLRITQYFAGHADPQTTSRYTRTTTRRLIAAVGSLDYQTEAA